MIRLSAFADEISQDPTEQLDVLERHGIRHVEFRAIHGVNVIELSDDLHAQFRDQLQTRGFGLSAIGSPIGKSRVEDAFELVLERFETTLGLAEFYAAPRVRVFSFYIPPGDDPDPHRDEVVRRMAELARRASDRGVTLFLENEKGLFGDTAARVVEILNAVGSPALSHAFDPANYLEVGQSIDQAWTMLKHHVTHFHVKDLDLASRRNVPAGHGAGRIPQLIADAVASGYTGFCVLEPHLIVAEKSYGFTGPERFGDAASALKQLLDERGIAWC